MNCLDWEERVALHAGGDLEGRELEEVERHLGDCPGCQVFWSRLRETLAGLRECHQEDVPTEHFAAVRAGVAAEIERGRRVWKRLAWVSGVGIAAALVLGLALRPAPLPGPPVRAALTIPAAPLQARAAGPTVSLRPAGSLPYKGHHAEPIVVKLQTADPKIVIYWIAD
jgi:hypothetical protein